MVDNLRKLVDWYWQYGVHRTEYTILPSDLYAIYEVLERQVAMAAAKDGKPCVAFWGPSQSGKSTSIASYIEGLEADGSDSAFVWKAGQKIRFGSKCGEQELKDVCYFNPFNGGADASALVTRFYLPDNVDEVDRDFPVKLIPASRKKILTALAVGYRLTCQRPDDKKVDIKREFSECANEKESADQRAFELLCDLYDVCKSLGKQEKYKEIECIPNTVFSSKWVKDLDSAWEFVSKILWDGNNFLTNVAKKFSGISMALEDSNGIITSMRAASILEDMLAATAPCEMSFFKNDDGVIRILCGDDDRERFSGHGDAKKIIGVPIDCLGELQASIGEMCIPLNPDRLRESKFKDFLCGHQLVDLPGVTNDEIGDNMPEKSKLDLWHNGNVDTRTFNGLDRDVAVKFYKDLYKTGMTFSVVHGLYSIDSFVIFCPCHTDGCDIRNPVIFNAGVDAWLAPYGGKENDKLPLDLFVNFSRFGDTVVDRLVGSGNGLNAKNLAEKLTFAQWNGVGRFFTTNSSPDNQLTEKTNKQAIETIISQDSSEAFVRKNESEEARKDAEALRALFNDPMHLGTDYMFKRLNEIKTKKRLSLYSGITRQNIDCVLSNIIAGDVCPPDENDIEREFKPMLKEVLNAIDEVMKSGDAEKKHKMGGFIKNLVYVDPEKFDSMLTWQNGLNDPKEVMEYLDKQKGKWREMEDGIANVPAGVNVKKLKKALSNFDDHVVEDIQTTFSFVRDGLMASEAKYPFALAFSNMLMTGEMYHKEIATVQPEEDSDWLLLCSFKERINGLINGGLNPGRRKPLPGDEDIKTIRESLEALKG